MFYDLISGVFYCTTSYPIDSLIYDRDYKMKSHPKLVSNV